MYQESQPGIMKERNPYIYGRNAVLEAISSGRDIEKIFLLFGTQGESINNIIHKAYQSKIPLVKYDKNKFAVLEKNNCPTNSNTQGVIALVSQVETFSLSDLLKISFKDERYPVLVALDGITDPHNLGAIARTAECAGCKGLILPVRDSAPITPVSIKVSSGALEHLPVAKVGNLALALERCKEAGYWIIGTDVNAGEQYFKNHYDRPVVLIIGSEGKGLHHSIAKHCDIKVRIPMAGKINSLNASVSAGVVLFEIVRQKTTTISI